VFKNNVHYIVKTLNEYVRLINDQPAGLYWPILPTTNTLTINPVPSVKRVTENAGKGKCENAMVETA